MAKVNPLRSNPSKWSNTLKQFVGNSRRIVSVFDHFVGLTLKLLLVRHQNDLHWPPLNKRHKLNVYKTPSFQGGSHSGIVFVFERIYLYPLKFTPTNEKLVMKIPVPFQEFSRVSFHFYIILFYLFQSSFLDCQVS